MYPASFAVTAPDRLAFVMAASGVGVTYRELDDRSSRLAGMLHSAGLRPGDTVLLALPNDLRWAEIFWACQRSGLYLAAVNWHLSCNELVPMVEDAEPRAVIASDAVTDAIDAALSRTDLARPAVQMKIGPDEPTSSAWADYDAAMSGAVRDPAQPETTGGRILFSSGTTGRPKPFRVHPSGVHPADAPTRSADLMRSLCFQVQPAGSDDDHDVLLIAGPAYHAGPIVFLHSVHQLGGTVVLMERFDAEGALRAIERHRVTHSQWVPTMFVRLLRLPADIQRRYDLSSQRVAIHGAAPCPPEIKQSMLDWWGPIVHEYYGASEGFGRTTIGPDEWLARPGSVGRPTGSALRIADADGHPLTAGEIGQVWFAKPGSGPPDRLSDGSVDLAATPGWGTSGDLGYVDDEGYLYLTGRVGHTIISGGVNIYPREIEDVLAAHPAVDDVAVLGMPDAEFGERVVAVVVPAAEGPSSDLGERLIASCRERLATFKCPREVRIVRALPRSDAGKIRLTELRDSLRPEPAGGAP